MAKKIYCIDEISQSNFLSFGLNAEIASDMRYDQMNEVRNEPFESQVIDDFLSQNTKPILIFGSIWPQEIDLITQNLEKLAGFKSIIVPHKISNDSTEFWKKALPNLNIASHRDKINNQSDFLLYDIMGDLSKLYRYGDIAYIGGGFQGLVHSLIEPMAYGLGLIIMGRGPKNLEVLQLQNAKLLLCLTQARDFSENIASYLTHIEDYKKKILDTFNQKTGTLPKVLQEVQKLL
jgi:3-deoxy-D-manno-octulosonic-acid transferase